MTPRLLLIFAHPDDESFVAAGLARRYADAGAQIALVTATRGEAGSRGDPPLCTEEELPAWRESELRDAAAILGIGNIYLLGYRDKHLTDAPPAIVREQLVELIACSACSGRRPCSRGMIRRWRRWAENPAWHPRL